MAIYKNSGTSTLIARDIYGISREIDPGENVSTYEILSSPWAIQSTKPKFNPCTLAEQPTCVGAGTLATYTTISLETNKLLIQNKSAFDVQVYFGDASNTPYSIVAGSAYMEFSDLENKVQWMRLVAGGAIAAGEVIIQGFKKDVKMFVEGVLK